MSLNVMTKPQILKLMNLIEAIQNFTQHCYDSKGYWKGTVNIPLLQQQAEELLEATQQYLDEVKR